ncbi:nuclear transport factor 2 family protein [Candidatus Bandiella euplotis]|nr:hypothetical protein [Candidatus Bandiella woodruffii]
MKLDETYVKEIFTLLENSKNQEFFKYVDDNVIWQVMGTHPLAGTYHNKASFITSTFGRLATVLQEGGVILKVENLLIIGPFAIVEMRSLSHTKSGKPFDNTYCWIAKFDGGKIAKVKAYVDSALVADVINSNSNL